MDDETARGWVTRLRGNSGDRAERQQGATESIQRMVLREYRYFVCASLRPAAGTLHMSMPNAFSILQYHATHYLVYPKKALDPLTSHSTIVGPGERLVRFFEKHWHLAPPDVAISVTGSAQGLKELSPRLVQVFETGMVALCERSHAWVITGGLDTGVMKQVAEPLHKYKFSGKMTPVIGFAVRQKVRPPACGVLVLAPIHDSGRST
jgi:hypothetical protein